MKTLKGMALSMLGLVAAIAAQMFGWVIVSCGLLATAVVLCALAVSEEMDERSEQECRKIKRVSHHTSEWRDAQ